MAIKPAKTLIVTDACLIEGVHTEIDTVLTDVPFGAAIDLLSSGRVKEATKDDVEAAKARVPARAARR